MKKVFFLTLLAIFVMNDYSYGQALVPREGPNGKWGFVDEAAGRLLIPFKYDAADGFAEGLASVCYGGKWGFIDRNDSAIIPFMYEWVDHFTGGLAKATLNGKTGFIDQTGETVIPFKYDFAVGFTLGNVFSEKGFSMVSVDGKYGFIDRAGMEIVPIKHTTEEAVQAIQEFINTQ